MIPKTLHYIWLGKDKPALVQQCISSFHTHLKDYDIVEWNENNIDTSLYDPTLKQFWHESYDNQKYAFCSDITRLYLILNHGGIYVDSDVEFIKPLPESFLSTPFLCRNNPTQEVNNGCIWADNKNSKLASACIRWLAEKLSNDHLRKTYGRGWIFNRILDSYFTMFGYDHHNCNTQDIIDYRIYPADYFCPKNIMCKTTLLSENTISIHHYTKSWKSNPVKE